MPYTLDDLIAIDNRTVEYSQVMATVEQPEQFVYSAQYGCLVHEWEVTDALGVKYRYVHMTNCMLYRIPVPEDPPTPPIEA